MCVAMGRVKDMQLCIGDVTYDCMGQARVCLLACFISLCACVYLVEGSQRGLYSSLRMIAWLPEGIALLPTVVLCPMLSCMHVDVLEVWKQLQQVCTSVAGAWLVAHTEVTQVSHVFMVEATSLQGLQWGFPCSLPPQGVAVTDGTHQERSCR